MDTTNRPDWYVQALDWRGVLDPCERCGGSGIRTYGSTATWRGGIGGASMTKDVCDICWGSGDKFEKGLDLRAQRDGEQKRIKERAITLLSEAAGANLNICKPALTELLSELDKLSRGRKSRPDFFYNITACLARHIREGIK